MIQKKNIDKSIGGSINVEDDFRKSEGQISEFELDERESAIRRFNAGLSARGRYDIFITCEVDDVVTLIGFAGNQSARTALIGQQHILSPLISAHNSRAELQGCV